MRRLLYVTKMAVQEAIHRCLRTAKTEFQRDGNFEISRTVTKMQFYAVVEAVHIFDWHFVFMFIPLQDCEINLCMTFGGAHAHQLHCQS